MVDEVPELVEEAERHPAVPPRHAHVDRVALAQAVAAALARRRRGADGNGEEIGAEEMERVGRDECAGEPG